MRRSYIRPILALLAIALLIPLAPAAGDAVLDAKRSAAAKLLKDGKAADAQKLYEEIIAQDDTVWSDHYALAKMYDKAGETPKAVEAYQKTVRLLKGNAKASAERSALADAEKRIRILDELSDKLEAVLERFENELKPLARDAERGKNAAVSEKIESIREVLAVVSSKSEQLKVTVEAKAEWVDTGVDVVPGKTVTFRASGVWNTLNGNSNFSCDADGRAAAGQVGGLPIGTLIARVGLTGAPIPVGVRRTISFSASGRLFLACNDEGRRDNVGHIEVLLVNR